MFSVVPKYFGKQSIYIENELRKIFTKYLPNQDIKLIFTNNFRLKSFFPYKDKMTPLLCSKIIYRYDCASCLETYIGMSSRNLYLRICEHKARSPYTGNTVSTPQFSAIREHCKIDCDIKNENFKIINTAEYSSDLNILEAIEIKIKQPTLNNSEYPLKVFC